MAPLKTRISVLIPCFNEEASVRRSVESALFQTRKPDQIVVVDDGSTDRSTDILREFGDRITFVRIPFNTGNKSYAQEYGLRFIDGDIFITADADTLLDRRFVEHIAIAFQDPNVAAVCGYVKSIKHNWLTACREIEYVFGQMFYKIAQSYINALIVVPGCAAAFRTDIFRRDVRYTHDTVTEDLDFTYQLHKKGYTIRYERSAVVYTQDPGDLASYVNQMRRWYRGGWQNLRKHALGMLNLPLNALELALVYGESLFFVLLLIITPFVNIQLFVYLLLAQLLFVLGLGVMASYVSRRFDLLFYAPLYAALLLLNNLIYVQEFFNEILMNRTNLAWLRAGRRTII